MTRILFASGRRCFPFFIGGDVIVIHSLLEWFAQAGHLSKAFGVWNTSWAIPLEQMLAKIGQLDPSYELLEADGQLAIQYQVGYPCLMVDDAHYAAKLDQEIATWRPDVVITQLDRSAETIDIVGNRAAVVLALHDIATPEDAFSRVDQCAAVVSCSHFIQQHYRARGVESQVIYPPIDHKRYWVKHNTQDYITMINPVPEKGGATFLRIARRLPQHRFLAVEGWNVEEVIPEIFHQPNITFMTRQLDMRNVYQQTKALLVPSLWPEGFGRVIPEALLNGIPAIASNNGGIHEAVGPGGLVIDDPEDVDAWVQAIQAVVEDTGLRQRLSAAGVEHAKQFSAERIVGQWLTLMSQHRRQSPIDQPGPFSRGSDLQIREAGW